MNQQKPTRCLSVSSAFVVGNSRRLRDCGANKTKDWQRRSTKLMVVAPDVIASTAAESAALSTFGRAGQRVGRSGSTRNHPQLSEEEMEARMAQVKADINAFREAGIRQRKPAIVGHSWDRPVSPNLLSNVHHSSDLGVQRTGLSGDELMNNYAGFAFYEPFEPPQPRKRKLICNCSSRN